MEPFPLPPLNLLQRTGGVDPNNPEDAYLGIGGGIRSQIEGFLPDGWDWTGKRVLDFGCGAGRVVRHFATEARTSDAEFWGCDIDEPSIAWMQENLCPPFHAFNCTEAPGLPQADGYFDLIYAISVYTHITDNWAGWLLEHHRVLADGGLLLASFLGDTMIQQIADEDWDEDRIGMNVLWEGNAWDDGGPVVFHSPWWLRAHWGRIFEVANLVPHCLNEKGEPAGHGLVLLRKRPVSNVSVRDLEQLEPGEEREILALRHSVVQLRKESALLRAAAANDRYRLAQELEAANAALAEAERRAADADKRAADDREAFINSRSWRVTAPVRAVGGLLRR